MPYIEIDGQARALGPGVLTIGSAPEAGWRFQARGLEPLHAVIALETGSRAMLMQGAIDANIQINDVQLEGGRRLLSFGDTVRLGGVEMRYRQFPPGAEDHSAAYLRDTRRGRVYLLRERSLVGRDVMSTIVIQDPEVSRTHCEIVRHEDVYVVVAHQANVVSVNGARVLAPTPLQEGDEIAVGRSVLRFTAAMPSGFALAEPSAGVGAFQGRQARAKTSFMGRVETDDLRYRDKRRKMQRVIMAVVTVCALLAAVASMVITSRPRHSTRTPANAAIRSHS